MGILPPKHRLFALRQLCLSPCITADLENISEYVMGFSMLTLFCKLELICDKLTTHSTVDPALEPRVQISLQVASVAPVLSLLALADIRRLQSRAAMNVIKVTKIKQNFQPREITVVQLLQNATLMTWVI